MIQVVISRIANYSATLKNYCITLVTAACGFSITLKIPAGALLALLPIVLFGLLDAQYLRIERRFRALFEKTRQEDGAHSPPSRSPLQPSQPLPISRFYGLGRLRVFTRPSASELLARC
jgi:hypothetical protein